ncbi:MAG: YggS family pyridoxal phosphate enzyme [Planctomycetes bacterium]|nr:YggS family pyridoxal phosphate enzyme [Planctomycetota bacterium]
MIGHLQTNKVRHALQLFDSVDALDSLHLAEELARRLAPAGGPHGQTRTHTDGPASFPGASVRLRPCPSVSTPDESLACGTAALGCAECPYPVLIECNASGEATKFGVRPDALPALLDAVRALPHIRVEGLMTMAPFGDDPEAARPVFAALRELAASARGRTGLPLPHLSMGMTQDFEVAIEEGATMVRIGTAIFRGVG